MTTEPPAGLGPVGLALWHSITEEYELLPHELRLLEDAAAQADMIAAMTFAWETEGSPMTSRGSQGQTVIHPLISEIRAYRNTLRQTLVSMKLPEPAVDNPDGVVVLASGQTRLTPSEAGKKAAAARWGTRG
jgi:hypothetical protein